MKQLISGVSAVAHAVTRCQPQIIAAYPITPQTGIIEQLASMVADAKLDATFINAENEYSAMSIALGATAAGTRAFTASASQGMLQMSEVLYNISGLRLPVVMVCTNRAIGAPIHIQCDHQDSMALRDAGWVQLYVESNQEAVDTVIQAYRIAENNELPVMVCMDGFYISHAYQAVEIPEDSDVDKFLPPFQFKRALNISTPFTLGGGAETENYQEYRYDQHQALLEAEFDIEHIAQQYAEITGRHYDLVESYYADQSDIILLTIGSTMGAVREVVDRMRSKGASLGAIKIRCFRPFPRNALLKILNGKKHLIVLEKAFSAGSEGILAGEIRSALQSERIEITVSNYIAGLGGRDISHSDLEQIIEKSTQLAQGVNNTFMNYSALQSKTEEAVHE